MELVSSGDMRTQEELVLGLESAGCSVHQASISRALRKLGIRKVMGVYRLAGKPIMRPPIHSFAVTAAGCMAILRTDPAFASVLAQVIDHGMIEGVLGTIAGDDTVFIATDGVQAVQRLRDHLGLVNGAIA